MIELRNVNKYFNKGKKNQIHVINNTTLSLEDKGLVALLGPSGCGKTTLLNVMGGLDRIKKGSIYINGEKISSRRISKVDKIRNLKVGYIFQDYKLIDSLSVYDNVAIVLKMIGIKDKNEIKNRVEYVLDKVGMLRYQKRPANMLSGGERQRVGIARAIVKDPEIILADEPTGNLDSKNTLEVMNMIKAISKDRLVILVTHEQELAKFYASRIIEIADGKIINDCENVHDKELEYELDNCFYLKDFKEAVSLSSQNSNQNIQIYSDKPEKISLDIVIKNNNIYIQTKDGKKIEVIDESSSIELIDSHRKKMDKEWAGQYQFHLKEIIHSSTPKKYCSVLNPITLIINGFKNIMEFPFLKKILLIGFFLAGMFIMYSVSNIAAALKIDEKDFVTTNPNYLIIEQAKIEINNYLEYEGLGEVDYLLPGDSQVTFSISYDDYYQTARAVGSLKGSLSSIDFIQKEDLIMGRMPENNQEIVVDSMAISKMLEENPSFKMVGIQEEKDLLNRSVKIKYMSDFTIVGIVNLESPCIYLNENQFINVLANSNQKNSGEYFEEISSNNSEGLYIDYTLYQDKIELKKGRFPQNDYEVIVDISNQETMPLNKEIPLKINNQKLKVVGYYDSKEGYSYYFVNNNMIKYHLIASNKKITINPQNKEQTIEYFRSLNLNIKDSYEQSKKNYLKAKQEEIKSTLLVSGVILIISLIEIFLMIRSSFLSRMKEIGILRAIGVKRSDIYKIFIGEIIAITSVAGIPGLILMAYILKVLSNISYLSCYIMINPIIVVISILFVYFFNLLIGLIPVYHTVKKRPAEILARYDLD